MLIVDTVPLGLYIFYMKRIAKNAPWNVDIDSNYEPELSIMVPTYDEASTITRKLDNIAQADYPKEKVEIIMVDSASKDQTVNLARDWCALHPKIKTRIICETERRGMVSAMNHGLKFAKGEVLVKTDADCLWLRDSLKNALKYLSDRQVGSVAGVHIIEASKETSSVKVERTYREFYKSLRIGESKLWSTVLYEGEMMLLKREIIERIGFDEEIGGDDVATALRMTEHGYRAISAEDAFFVEQTPYTWEERFRQKIRRGRHVFEALWKYKYLIFKRRTVFHAMILPFETYIYVVNPLIAFALSVLSVVMVAKYPWLLVLVSLLSIDRLRDMFITHLVGNSTMLVAMLMEIKGKEKATWEKIGQIREATASYE